MSKLRSYAGLVAVVVLISAAFPAMAAVKPHPLFSDNMVLQRDLPVPVWGWADEGEKVTVTCQGQTAQATAKDGKWQVELEPLALGGPATMTISAENTVTIKNVLVGEVWVCSGQSNMAFALMNAANGEQAIARSANPKIRLFTVPRRGTSEPQDTVEGSWSACGPETVGNFSAVGYFFGKHLQEKLGVPVGLINSSYGGTPAEAWTSPAMLASKPELKSVLDTYADAVARYPENKARHEKIVAKWDEERLAARKAGKPFGRRRPQPPMGPEHPKRPSALYHGMICPLQPFAIRGAIWYQGEGNASRAYQYRTLFPSMIECWRDDWGQGDFPFFFVQLAPFMQIVDEPADSAWAELREAQLMTMLGLPNTSMAVITDVGEQDDIHPKKKQPVGDRLALAARALANGEKIEYSGPIYKCLEIDGPKAILSFDHLGGGLTAQDGELTGFAICGEDRKFVNAQAVIQGDTVVVCSPQVAKPTAVRYGWADFPLGNLWNQAGLPASPFRTDQFSGITKP